MLEGASNNKLVAQLRANGGFLRRVINEPFSVREFGETEYWKTFLAPIMQFDRQVFVTCPHWGGYPQSLMRIGNSLRKDMPLSVARGLNWDYDEAKYWDRVRHHSGLSIKVFKILEDGQRTRFARSIFEGSNAIVLFDLDYDYGKTMPVRVYSWRLWFASGWILLAYRTKSVVIIFKPSSIDRNEELVHSVIDPLGYFNYKDFAVASLSACAKCLSELIAEEPAFWFNSYRLKKMLLESEPK